MEVILRDDLRTIEGTLQLEYVNNSPDTLNILFLKAFPNAVQKGSYADEKLRRQNIYDFAGLRPEEEGSLELFIPEGVPYRELGYDDFEFDNTIITVYLSAPLKPQDSLYLMFDFKTVLPQPSRLRLGYENGVTKAAYWYPQVCVYDHKLGWVNAQYLGWGENYGDFGTYDVFITAPADQVVAATGVLVNEGDVLPDTLRQKLDIRNFLRPADEWPEFAFEKGSTRTWHYIAENVNDFVFTSSNRFCIDTGLVEGVQVVAYPLRHKARSWVEAVELGKTAIRTYSQLFFPYQWPVIRICDAYSGMEYPMLTNCGGGGPSHGWSLLLFHEIGHQWFMGQIGFNQVDRPFLDEGFTTHAEHVLMEKYYGREGNMDDHKNWYERTFAPPTEDRNVRGFEPLLRLMKQGFDKPMIFSYDRGEEYWPYRVSAYYKAAAMHYALRSILGDSIYFEVMYNFCDEWYFAHPYEDELKESLENATGLELDEYLQQWFYGRERLDYAYDGMKTVLEGQYYYHTVKLKRPGDFISPVDIAVIFEHGDTAFYNVAPEGMSYTKKGYAQLPTWHQFRRWNDRYEFTVRSQRRIKKVVLDPYQLLADIDRRNNQSGLIWPVEIRLDNMKYDRTPLDRYALRWRPDLWYDEANGLQAGFHIHGSYLEIENRFKLDFRLGTESGKPGVDALYSTPFRPFGFNSKNEMHFIRADCRTFFSQTTEKIFKQYYSREDCELFRLELNFLNVDGRQDNRFDHLPEKVVAYLPDMTWDANKTYYAVMQTGMVRTWRYGKYVFRAKTTIGGYDENDRLRGFDQMELGAEIHLEFKKKPNLKLTFGMLNTGGEPPSHFLHHLSRVPSAERFIKSQVFRSPGTFPTSWENDFYLVNERVRGYQDRIIYLTSSFGTSLEMTVPDLLPYRWLGVIPGAGGFLSSLDQGFFVDMASVSMDNKEKYYPWLATGNETVCCSDERMFYLSAGISVSMPPVWSEHRIRLDFPLYLNKPGTGEREFAFRFSVAWLLPE